MSRAMYEFAHRGAHPWMWVQVFYALAKTKLFLATRGLQPTLCALGRQTASLRATSGAADQLEANGWIRRVAILAALWPGRAVCLEQSVAAYYLLRSRGIDARVRIGVQSFKRGAHAWIEVNGVPIGEPDDLLAKLVTLPDFSGEGHLKGQLR